MGPFFIGNSPVEFSPLGGREPCGQVNEIRKRGRVVDCTGLENRRPARVREFESHRFRQSTP